MIKTFPLACAAMFSCLSIIPAAHGRTGAGGIRLLCAVALKPAMETLIPEFEKSSGLVVEVGYETVGALTELIRKGEPVDVAIVSGPQNDALQSQGKIVPGSRIDLAKVGIGAFVRKGAPKPDFSSLEAFRRTLLGAQSIAYPDPAGGGASGVYMARLLDRLGLGEEMKPKIRVFPAGDALYASVVGGQVQIGFNQISENLAAAGVAPAAPLPPAIQNYTIFAAGVGTASRQAEADKALIDFLSSPAASAIMKTRGYE